VNHTHTHLHDNPSATRACTQAEGLKAKDLFDRIELLLGHRVDRKACSIRWRGRAPIHDARCVGDEREMRRWCAASNLGEKGHTER
jgi:hypothetical protein